MTELNTTETAPGRTPAGSDAVAPTAEAVAPPASPPVPKDRRKLFAALRWTAAVLVFATVGAGVTYGITRVERTDVPGLSTKDDGRWKYPALVKPELPAGAALPFAEDNPEGIHYAGLNQLLLPAPAGATPDPTLKLEKDEAVPVDTFLEEYQAGEREKLKASLVNGGLRQIAGRGWTTPDGTRTRIYLLRFHGSGFVDAFKGCTISTGLANASVLEADPVWSEVKRSQRNDLGSDGSASGPSWRSAHDVTLYQEAKPTGDEQVRFGCVQSGDVQALVLQTRKGQAPVVPLHQTVILQSQLLG
ncbi:MULTISPECIES: hypothetical protein [unclassified Streptomyces]|uniref:hypothetical protein n=1 Tax=unclassified Streptomyces TaxID=2593676 RepID=UPI002E2ECDA4|nr:hypothetical protein [Streptomyces sp. NBC_01278]